MIPEFPLPDEADLLHSVLRRPLFAVYQPAKLLPASLTAQQPSCSFVHSSASMPRGQTIASNAALFSAVVEQRPQRVALTRVAFTATATTVNTIKSRLVSGAAALLSLAVNLA